MIEWEADIQISMVVQILMGWGMAVKKESGKRNEEEPSEIS